MLVDKLMKKPKATYVTTMITTEDVKTISFYSSKSFITSGLIKEGLQNKDTVISRKNISSRFN
jgi:hypothetical protein